MDGTVAPIKGLRDLADKYRTLLAVDDSHATGFFGATGRWVKRRRLFYYNFQWFRFRRRVMFHARLKELSAQIEGARYRANCLPGQS